MMEFFKIMIAVPSIDVIWSILGLGLKRMTLGPGGRVGFGRVAPSSDLTVN